MTAHEYWRRAAGAGIIAVSWFVFDPKDSSVVQQLLLPLCVAAGAYLVLQTLLPVALASAVLAVSHTQLGAADWVHGWAYPAIACASTLYVVIIIWQRFRRRVAQTHEARWSSRQK